MAIELNKTDIEDEIAALGAEQSWNHNILLPFGIETSPSEQVSHGKKPC